MLHGVTAHDGFFFEFERPAFFIYIENNRLDPKLAGGYLCAEPGAKTGVQKQKADPFSFPQGLIRKRIFFVVKRFANQLFQVNDIGEGNEIFHA
jgi:hypothetical protein